MPEGRFRFVLLLSIFFCALPQAAAADPVRAAVAAYVPDARKTGEGVLRYLFWDVYRAALYAPAAGWDANRPFALTLLYMRDLDGRDIADRTISEIEEQGFTDRVSLARWRAMLRKIFPDVTDGTRLTGIRDRAGATVFYRGGTRIGVVEDPEFTRRFFDIWLGEKTSEPALRNALLGGE